MCWFSTAVCVGFQVPYFLGLYCYTILLPLPYLILSCLGALAGAALVGGVPLDLMCKCVLEVALQASQLSLGVFSPSFSLSDIMWDGMNQLLPDDIHLKASERLYISVTRIADRTNLLVNQFATKQELLEALRASSFVPLMSGWNLPRFRGALCFDGGYSDNLPVFDPTTITVSPFAGSASICPEDDDAVGALLNVKIPHGANNSSHSFNFSKENSVKLINAVVPPGLEGMEGLCSQGFTDAMRFLKTNNYLKCQSCKELGQQEPATLHHIQENNKPIKEAADICSMCKTLQEEAASKTLPMEIKDIFREVALSQGSPGGLRRVVSLIVIAVSVSFRLAYVGVSVPYKIVEGVTYVRCAFVRDRTPSIENCPFGETSMV